MFHFTDKIVIVTGASGNLGSAVARAFHSAGGKIALVDRDAQRLNEIFADLAEDSACFFPGSVDLTDEKAVTAMTAELATRWGRIDVLVNIAGGYRAGTPLHETPLETWDFMMNLNAKTVFIASKAVIPHMIKSGSGKIISIAAKAGLVGTANHSAYNASKSAVIRLTESLAAELKGYGINVNCILPGTIDTPQNRAAMPNADTSKWVAPSSLADVILFLASDYARDIHGAAVPVYGLGG